MEVSPRSSSAGGEDVGGKRARDKARGPPDIDKEKASGHAGVRAPRKQRRKP